MDNFTSPEFNLQTKFVLHETPDANPLPSSGQHCPPQISFPALQGKDSQQAAPQPLQTLRTLQLQFCLPLADLKHFPREPGQYLYINPESPDPKPHCSLPCDRTQHSVFQMLLFSTMTSNPHTLRKDYTVCSPSGKNKTNIIKVALETGSVIPLRVMVLRF